MSRGMRSQDSASVRSLSRSSNVSLPYIYLRGPGHHHLPLHTKPRFPRLWCVWLIYHTGWLCLLYSGCLELGDKGAHGYSLVTFMDCSLTFDLGVAGEEATGDLGMVFF